MNLDDAFTTSVYEDDIKMWEKAGRFDILEWICYLPTRKNPFIYDIWFNPKTGNEVLMRCPWLRKLPKRDKYICRIHDVKPRHCKEYPKSKKHAAETSCKGF
jgi:Fe-S-cluster containining protein